MTSSFVTERLARHIESAHPGSSNEAMEAARRGMLDFLAVSFAGCRDPGARRLRKALGARSQLEASVIGGAHAVDLPDAALCNGYAAHALDYDDQHGPARGHPSTVLLPALLAVCEAHRCDVSRLLEAYVVGVEVMARLGLALGARHYEQGFHQTATIGAIAAAASCAYLLQMDASTIENALGFAVAQASGLRFQFASDGKPLQAGLAARAGVLAIRLAGAGIRGASACLDGDAGFFNAYGGDTSEPELSVQSWGDPWQIARPGLLFKAYPCCVAAHYAAEASLRLREEQGWPADRISTVRVSFPVNGDLALKVRSPRTGLEGRFSVEYVVALALIEGKLGVDAFADVPIRADISALAARVTRFLDQENLQ